MGQPLNLAVPLRLDPGEEIEPRCISAEVTVGDRRLPASAVVAMLEMLSPEAARVRVQTQSSVDEPVVNVVLTVGCQSRLTRSFVVLADPPGLDLAAANPAPLPMFASALPAAPLQETAPADPVVNAALPDRSAAASRQSRPARTPDAARPNTRVAANTSANTSANNSANARSAERRDRTASGQAPRRVAAVRPVAKAAATPSSRLRLEKTSSQDASPGLSNAELLVVEQAIRAVAEAASAVRAANSAAAAAQLQAQSLDRSLLQLRAENQAQRETAAVMRERLSRAEASTHWLWPMLAGLLALGALAAWLAWQLAALRRAQRLGWQQAAQEGTPAPTPSDDMADKQVTSPASFVTAAKPGGPQRPSFARPQATPAWPPPAPAEPSFPPSPTTVADGSFAVSTQPGLVDLDPVPAMQRTLPLPVAAPPADATNTRELSIEELIDLEQQAEFFVVLGQDDAAIDLLVEHVRTTGGGSPLPYLKLLEIYYRLGDREAYERTRARFNQRFNAYAAEWSAGLQEGRSLEGYPGVLPRLAHVWPRPLDAMAELEALLFRKSRGELFDLPAYREVLFLYALARDLLDREAVATGSVDLLLPLADGGDFGVTSPHPYFGLDRDSVFDRFAAEDRPTAPVDLDLTQMDTPPSIFDPLAARRTEP